MSIGAELVSLSDDLEKSNFSIPIPEMSEEDRVEGRMQLYLTYRDSGGEPYEPTESELIQNALDHYRKKLFSGQGDDSVGS